MSLQVAPCPNCGAAVVFGERRCRTCGQAFDYGATAPAIPTTEQVIAALRAVGVIVDAPPAAAGDDSIFAAVADAVAAVRPSMGPGAAASTGTRSSTTGAGAASPATGSSTMLELDSGRYDAAEDVDGDAVPGLIDSTLFASMTPERVEVEALPGLELTAFGGGDASPSSVGRLADLEPLAGDVGAVAVEHIPCIYHSDMFHTDVDVAAGAAAAGDVLEVSPSTPRTAHRPTSASDAWERVACPACGTVHASARCPNCATAHPNAPTL